MYLREEVVSFMVIISMFRPPYPQAYSFSRPVCYYSECLIESTQKSSESSLFNESHLYRNKITHALK